MSEEKDGGPAFPNTYDYFGMSLRDYFAAHAPEPPVGWRDPGIHRRFRLGIDDIVEWRWVYADRMIAQRMKP